MSNSKPCPILPLEYCTVERAVRMFASYGVEKEDIQHWVKIGALKESIVLDGAFTASSVEDLRKNGIEVHIKQWSFPILQLGTASMKLVPLLPETPEECLKFLRKRDDEKYFLSKSYGVWDKREPYNDNLLNIEHEYKGNKLVTLIPLKNDFEVVLKNEELQKLLRMIERGERHDVVTRELTISDDTKEKIELRTPYDSLVQALGAMTDYISTTAPKFKHGNKPNCKEIASHIDEYAKSNNLTIDNLSNFQRALSLAYKKFING